MAATRAERAAVAEPAGTGPEAGDGAMRLVLGSASPRRRDLLARVGVIPDEIRPAAIDETPRAGELPRAYAERMAFEKGAALIAGLAPEAAAGSKSSGSPASPLVLTADTVVSAGRRILGKPADRAEAERFLRLLSGRRHRVTTAVHLVGPGGGGAHRTAHRTVVTRVKIKRVSEDEIAGYLRSGEWRGKAGGYAIQGLAAAFIPEIHGSYTNVVGLPLTETVNLLTGMGYPMHYGGRGP